MGSVRDSMQYITSFRLNGLNQYTLHASGISILLRADWTNKMYTGGLVRGLP